MKESVTHSFFELLQVSIGVRERLGVSLDAEEWKQMLTIAKKQELVGVVFVGVQRLKLIGQGPDDMLYLTWMGLVSVVQHRNEMINNQCVEIQEVARKAGFRTCILKGQGNAMLYNPELQLMRTSGDIDLWLEGGYERVMAWVQATIPTDDVHGHHAHYHYFKDTDVEIHYRPIHGFSPRRNRVLDDYFETRQESCFTHRIMLPNGGKITVPDVEFSLVQQLAHIFQHFTMGGIGLRQLMDYYFLLIASTEEQRKEVASIVKKLHLPRFVAALMWLLEDAFALSPEKMLILPNEKDGRFLLEEVMRSGNFGHDDERIPKGMGYWKSFWFYNTYSLRLSRFDYTLWLWLPIMRMKGFLWRKSKGYK